MARSHVARILQKVGTHSWHFPSDGLLANLCERRAHVLLSALHVAGWDPALPASRPHVYLALARRPREEERGWQEETAPRRGWPRRRNDERVSDTKADELEVLVSSL